MEGLIYGMRRKRSMSIIPSGGRSWQRSIHVDTTQALAAIFKHTQTQRHTYTNSPGRIVYPFIVIESECFLIFRTITLYQRRLNKILVTLTKFVVVCWGMLTLRGHLGLHDLIGMFQFWHSNVPISVLVLKRASIVWSSPKSVFLIVFQRVELSPLRQQAGRKAPFLYLLAVSVENQASETGALEVVQFHFGARRRVGGGG